LFGQGSLDETLVDFGLWILDFGFSFVQLLLAHFFSIGLKKEINRGEANDQDQDHHRADEDHFGGRGTGHALKHKG